MTLSTNTQAILLLTAPLLSKGSAKSSLVPLPLNEYNWLTEFLQRKQKQPSDLLLPDAHDLIDQVVEIDPNRLKNLLGRGALMSNMVEQWQARSIWVMSRADPEYPKKLKDRLKKEAPPILYGCGNPMLLDTGWLAIVGSRDVDEALISYTEKIGKLAAAAQRAVVSGGARGIDQNALHSTLEARGKAIAFLADNLAPSLVDPKYRKFLQNQSLVLVSAVDPIIGFIIGNAMQRNKYIYALAECALVVNSDYAKGGTWTGAIEQLDKRHFVPVYVRSEGQESKGLEELKRKGALPWPNPESAEAFNALLINVIRSNTNDVRQGELFSSSNTDAKPPEESLPLPLIIDNATDQLSIVAPESPLSASEELFAKVRELILNTRKPMTVSEIVQYLDVTKSQAEKWLERLCQENVIEKRQHGRSTKYQLKLQRTIDTGN